MKSIFASIAIVLSGFAVLSEAHISFRYPCPRRGPYSECPRPGPNEWNLVDYDIRTPLGTYGSIVYPMCKWSSSFAGTRPIFQAGQTVNTVIDIGAYHKGGSCQFALSYDNGSTWVVFQDKLATCMADASNGQQYQLPITIPASAPSGNAVLNLIWNNNEGNRELYSSCADIVIQGTNGGSLSGVAPLIANYGPNSVFLPELALAKGDYGKKHFDARKPITVTVPRQTAITKRRLKNRSA
ncbi:hypothetical protein BX616_000356 [Lobosporangium transversale]|uniref:Chitin-binding type-4 domain-containing protein n=1 Tax=Lobosporangium transversale TaxID=64571 RepID=A0A1Y2G7I8_9FUNG|nr:hypothetical protein BCR41DRAFT_426301 [Lobosporangium transversale]KAF9907695.1 hypothetical protein BX616_000356 [Lobosporangium transversale]ORZ00039.1 hypothetical protein BCR41DRAFT_426301 [Lobosporangium transversale]|eukprot:XP_021876080.1 hypothetical protein BCR41DRAFT_426301 [Lobosporangium transversale]